MGVFVEVGTGVAVGDDVAVGVGVAVAVAVGEGGSGVEVLVGAGVLVGTDDWGKAGVGVADSPQAAKRARPSAATTRKRLGIHSFPPFGIPSRNIRRSWNGGFLAGIIAPQEVST